MFALVVNTPDYTNVKFIMNHQKASEEYWAMIIDSKEDEDYINGVALFEITGEGNLQVGQGFGSDEGVKLLYCYPEQVDNFIMA